MNNAHTNSMTLTSLVILKQQIDDGKDYYDYLVPFIEQIYIEEPDHAFDAGEIKAFMDSDFGLIIPQEVLRFILQRMTRKRILKEESNKFSKGNKFKGKDLRTDQNKASSQIGEVIQALQKFARSLGLDNLSSKEAMEAIQRFLAKFQIECISTYIQKTALPPLTKIGHWDEGLVGLFIKDILDNNSHLFEKFMVLVQGNMMANALISTDTSTPPDKFRKMTFYFDTPNLLNALGYSGDEKQTLALEMISLLKRLNGRIAAFEHSVDEAVGVMTAVANNIDDIRYAQKPLNLVARHRGWKKSDLIIKANKLPLDLEHLGFHIKQHQSISNYFKLTKKSLKHF